MVNNFSYFYDLINLIKEKKELPLQSVYLIGSRKSGKTLSIVEFLSILLFLENARVRIYVFRKNAQDIEQSVWEEIISFLETINLPTYINKIYRRIKYKHSKMTFHALHDRNKKKLKLSGIAGANKYDYAILWFEEAFEFNEQDIQEVKEAVRGNVKRMYLYSCNPWSETHWLIDYCNKSFPFNDIEMINKGFQRQHLKKELFHYTNYQINNLLSTDDYEQLEEVKRLNPVRARTACYGLTGIEQGAIYSHAIPKVSRLIPEGLIWFSAGIDFGYIKDACALVIIGMSQDYKNVAILNEYYHSNSGIVHKDNIEMANDMLKVILETMNQYSMIGVHGITIYCDTSNYAMIEILNKLVINRRIFNVLFRPCKKIEVYLRVGLQLDIMESSRLSVDIKATNFMRELSLARWDDRKAKPTPLDVDNHTQDAFHYAITPYYAQLQAKLNPYLILKS